jgi:anti-sigma B factor antagonist
MGTSRGTEPAGLFTVDRHLLGDGVVSVRVRGEVDSVSGPALEKALTAEITGGPRELRLDLDSVSFFSSAGITILLAAQRRCTAAEVAFVVQAPREVRRLLSLVGIDDVVSVVDSAGEPG